MTTETSNARGEVVAWFPTNAQGEIIRNYGDGSPVYACKTKEEAEQAKRCHLGATGPVIPLYAAPPPAAARVDVRGLVALAEQMERDAAGCRRDGYIDAAVVKEDCAQRIRQTLGISAIAEALAAEGVQAGEVEQRAGTDEAMHWIDRYAAGIDSECQIDRIASALSQQPSLKPEARGGVDGVLDAVRKEIERATAKFPTWPTDPLHACGVVQEESGELAKAVLQAVYEPHKSTPEDVATEAFQTAAMAIRFLASMDRYDWKPGEQHEQGAALTESRNVR